MQNLEDYFDVDASDFCPIIVWVFARELTRYLSTASASQFRAVAAQAEEEFKAAAAERRPRAELRVALTQRLKARFGAQQPPLGLGLEDESVSRFVESTVGAFLDQDLLQAVRRFLANAKGSFGLFVSCSLDAHRQFVLAARGQTISLAFYPKQGIVLWGSEQVEATDDARINRIEGSVHRHRDGKDALKLPKLSSILSLENVSAGGGESCHGNKGPVLGSFRQLYH